jgi:hypothetical protein
VPTLNGLEGRDVPALLSPLVSPTGDLTNAVAVGDFNGDGKQDVFAAHDDGSFRCMLGQGNGQFVVGQQAAVGGRFYAVAALDINQDGKLDVALVDFDSNEVDLLSGQGNGQFAYFGAIDVGTAPNSIAAADWNKDGKTDLIVSNAGDDTLSILLDSGPSSYTQAVMPAGENPGALAVADFNKDGKKDVAVVNSAFGPSSVSVYLGNGGGAFGAPKTFAVGQGALALAVGDFNKDGKKDLVVANVLDDTVSILRGRGDGTFKP